MKKAACHVLVGAALMAAGLGTWCAAASSPRAAPARATTPAGFSEWLVYGRVVDEALVPIGGARLSQEGRPWESVTTGADGTFTVWVHSAQTPEHLVIEAEGFATRFYAVAPPFFGQEQMGDIPLKPGGTMQGRVLGPDGAPVVGAAVTVSTPELSLGLEHARLTGPPSQQLLHSSTGADGRFEIAGVSVGPMTLWAGADRMRFTLSPPIAVQARRTTDDIELRLEPLQPEDWFHGIVLSPDGAPVAGVKLRCREVGGMPSHDILPLDSAGCFKLLRSGVVYDFELSDDAQRWAPVRPREVRPGKEVLELRFLAPRWIEVHVRNERGEAREQFRLSTCTPDGFSELTRAKGRRHPEGRARLLVPNEPFLVRVETHGFASAERGPFSPEDVPAELALALLPDSGEHER